MSAAANGKCKIDVIGAGLGDMAAVVRLAAAGIDGDVFVRNIERMI